jgi:hypothetical protein
LAVILNDIGLVHGTAKLHIPKRLAVFRIER